MIQMVYMSAASFPIDGPELVRILEVSRRNNVAVGVTGMLLYEGGSFLQALEGPEDAVEAVYQRIAGDPRHRDIQTLYRTHVTTRTFGEWSMGFVHARRDWLQSVPGYSDFFRGSAQVSSGAVALKLLREFRYGQWRQQVQTGAEQAEPQLC